MSVRADCAADFLRATHIDSFQGSGKIPNVKEALTICAKFGARKGRALATTSCGMPSLPLACVEK